MYRLRASFTTLLHASRLPRILSPAYSGVGSIFALHRIGPSPEPDHFCSKSLTVQPDRFRTLIELLLERRYEIVTMSGALRRLEASGDRPQQKFACLTFDDGYRDNFLSAYRICRAHGVPMVVYLTTGFIQQRHPMWWLGLERIVAHEPEIVVEPHRPSPLGTKTHAQKRRTYNELANLFGGAPPDAAARMCDQLGRRYGVDFWRLTAENVLTEDMILEMQDSGLVEFGAHTIRHVALAKAPPRLLADELRRSRNFLERLLEGPVLHFAYPFGDATTVNRRAVDACRAHGFRTGVTTRLGNVFREHRDHLHSLPRLTLTGYHQDLRTAEVLLTGALPAIRWSFRRMAPC